jgi:aspartokinase/homoserine dehydrogenase 1
MALKWKVHKFGGTSVLNAERYRGVLKILNDQPSKGPKAVVVSAMKGVTDDLLKAVEFAKGHLDYQSVLAQLQKRHETEIAALLKNTGPLLEIIHKNFKELEEILHRKHQAG